MYILRQNRAVLAVGVVTLLLALPMAGFILLTTWQVPVLTDILLFVLILGAGLIGGYAVYSFLRFRMWFRETDIVYRPNFGQKRTFCYTDIIAAELTPGRCRLVGAGDCTLAVFTRNLENVTPVFTLLQEKGIPFREAPKISRAKQAEQAYIRAHWSDVQMVRQNKRIKWFGRALLVLTVLAVLSSYQARLLLSSAVPLLSWILYLWEYPRMRLEPVRSHADKPYYIQMPLGPCAVCLLLLTSSGLIWFTPDEMFFRYALILSGLVYLPAAVVLLWRHAHPGRALYVMLAALVLGFSLTPPVQYLSVRAPAEHRLVQVMDKKMSTGKSINYYLYVPVEGESRRLRVTAGVYRASEVGGPAILCHKTSVFGYEFWQIHAVQPETGTLTAVPLGSPFGGTVTAASGV